MKADRQYKHITIEEQPPIVSAKTKRWTVKAKIGDIPLGEIRWRGAWRCYSYFPQADTLYEHNCLWDIADFLSKETSALRETWKARRKPKYPC